MNTKTYLKLNYAQDELSGIERGLLGLGGGFAGGALASQIFGPPNSLKHLQQGHSKLSLGDRLIHKMYGHTSFIGPTAYQNGPAGALAALALLTGNPGTAGTIFGANLGYGTHNLLERYLNPHYFDNERRESRHIKKPQKNKGEPKKWITVRGKRIPIYE